MVLKANESAHYKYSLILYYGDCYDNEEALLPTFGLQHQRSSVVFQWVFCSFLLFFDRSSAFPREKNLGLTWIVSCKSVGEEHGRE